MTKEKFESTVTITLSEYNILLEKEKLFDAKAPQYVCSISAFGRYSALSIIEPNEVQKILIERIDSLEKQYHSKAGQYERLIQQVNDTIADDKKEKWKLW